MPLLAGTHAGSLHRLPRIEDGHACEIEISDVAGHHRHAMYKGRGRNQCVSLAALVGYMQAGAALRHGSIDGQRSRGELGQDMLLQP